MNKPSSEGANVRLPVLPPPDLTPPELPPPELTPAELKRRTLLTRICGGTAALIGLVIATPVIGFIFAPMLRRPPELWRAVGGLDQFTVGATVKVEFEDASSLPWSGVTARSAAWLRRVSASEFIAFSVNCRHLGCPVRWVADAELFMCPCHGGVYYKDGTVAAGPPPEPLQRYQVRVRDGQVELLASPLPLTVEPDAIRKTGVS